MSTLLERGTILDSKWEILGHIPTRGKDEFYLAQQIDPDRQVVVVKTISSDYLMEFDEHREEMDTTINRFHREARAMAEIRHPNVVQVHDDDSTMIAGKDTELTVPYLVMEYVPGYTLRSTMPPKGLGESEENIRAWILDYFLPILDGMENIHNRGIVHREIKPENVLMDGSNPKIADFGMAGGVQFRQSGQSDHIEETILYVAPEQFSDVAETDARADVYSLGMILYEAVCGRMAESESAVSLRTVRLPNPATRFLEGLDQIIQESTAEDKERRTPSAKALRQRLEKLLDESEAVSNLLPATDLGTSGSFYSDSVQNSSLGERQPAHEKGNPEQEDLIRENRTEEMIRSRIEALERSNKDLEKFAYVTAHELKEPLVGIAAYLKILERRCKGRLDPETNRLVSHALGITLRMDSFVQTLLAYSRLGSGPKSFQPTDCNVAMRSALSNLRSAIEAAGAKVTSDSLPTVMGDPELMVQLFQNLVSNAIKFAGDGPPEIHLGATRKESSWQFCVSDNGIGIEPPYFDRIFGIFQRVEASGGRAGTGIGLANCKKIVEHHGGRIWVESEPGKGSLFFFTIPDHEGSVA